MTKKDLVENMVDILQSDFDNYQHLIFNLVRDGLKVWSKAELEDFALRKLTEIE